MSILQSLIKKEALHIVRDRRTMIITLVMPLVLLLLFGFAISTEVNDVRIAVVVDRHNHVSRDIVESFEANDYFTFKGLVSDREVNGMMRRRAAFFSSFFALSADTPDTTSLLMHQILQSGKRLRHISGV